MNKNKFTKVPILNSTSTHVQKNLKMYWGKDNPQAEDVINELEKQLMILNSSEIKYFKHGEWYFFGAKTDWIESGLSKSRTVKELFEKGTGFPEAGGFSLRSEFFTYEFTEDLMLWRKEELTLLKGEVDEDLEVIFKCSYPKGVAICFRGNMYLKNKCKGSVLLLY